MDPDLTIRIRIPDWRERLTKVERLLTEMADNIVPNDCLRHAEALAEVRAILKGS